MRPARTSPAILAVALAALAAAAHARALEVGFFSDDLTWLARMDATRAHPQYLLAIFGRDFTPLFHLSLLIDYLVAGPAAWMFHASSIAVHCACAVLLMALLRRLGAGAITATLVAATWALNVRLSEAVIWPAARCHSLAALLVLAAFVVLAGRYRHRVALATAILTIGLLAKETAIAGVALAPLFLSRDGGDERAPAWRHFLRAWPFVALGAAFLAFNHLAKPGFGLSSSSAADLLLKVPFILLRPLGLGDLYAFTWPGFALVMTCALALALALRRTTARLGFAWLLVLVAIIVPLEKVSSRYLYVLAIGHSLVLCGLIEHVGSRLVTATARRMVGALAIGAVTLVLVANVLLIRREIEDYASLAARYEACLQALRPAALDLEPGTTVVVIDTSPRDAIASMIAESWERGGIVKLIPDRAYAVGGLVPLADAMNIARERQGSWAIPGPAVPDGDRRVFTFDGSRLHRAGSSMPATGGLAFTAHLGTFEEMRAAERAVDQAAIAGIRAGSPRGR